MEIILGIDPGSRCTGYGVITIQKKRQQCLANGHVLTHCDHLSGRLHEIYKKISEIINQYQPQQVAIEKVFVHRNANSALKLGQARGAALVAAAVAALPIAEYSAKQIKQAIVGYGAASKDQMQRMVARLLNLSQLPQADAADALAVAICHSHSQHFQSIIKGTPS